MFFLREKSSAKKIINALLSKSQSPFFDKARSEWKYAGEILPFEHSFSVKCELCGKEVNHNYKIFNSYNKMTLKIDKTCIKNFILLDGCKNQQKSNELLELKRKETKLTLDVIGSYRFIKDNQLCNEAVFISFKEKLVTLLTIRKESHLIKTNEGLKKIAEDILNIPNSNSKDITQLITILGNFHDYKELNKNTLNPLRSYNPFCNTAK